MTAAFTELVGLRVPVQQAGMGGVTTPALAAAVAREGGLGMLAAAGLGADEVARQLGLVEGAGRVGVNFLMPFLDMAAFEAACGAAAVVECFYDWPDAGLVDRAHAGGALAAWQVGSVDEAKAAVDAGCDFVVVQGVEAGGHVRGTSLLAPLLDAVRPVVDVPVVAAGGLGSAAAVAAAFDAGADGARIGTRLLAAAEADVHPAYLDALVAAGADDTVVTEAFAAGWPDAPHRVLRSCVEASDDDPATRLPFPPTREFVGDVASAAMYAGTSVDGVRGPQTVAEIISELLP